jgi:hypothetical protein
MAKTEKSLKTEKIIEKLINMNNMIETYYTDPMGQDVGTNIYVKYDSKTSMNEIDDDFIDKHNQIQGTGPLGYLNKIKHGTKFYGTVYVRVIKLEEIYLDEDEQEEVSTNINPQKDDINWSVSDEIYSELLDRLYKFLPHTLYDIDVELTFNRNGI